jgi:hypothetical protein
VGIYVPAQIRHRLYDSIAQDNCHSLQTEMAHLQHVIDIYIAGNNLLSNTYDRFTHIVTDNIDKKEGFDHATLLSSGVLKQEEINDLEKWFVDASPIMAKHTLGSANYLLTATEQANSYYENRFIIDKSNILNPALKAVIYHATPQHTFKPKEQPVCAMLVLLDELYEWEHSLDAKAVADRASLVPLKLHLPVLPYTSLKSKITYVNNTFNITLIHGAPNSAVVHMEILRLAQMYGRFEFLDDKETFDITINLEDNDWYTIRSDIANAALNTESAVRPLLLRWLNKQPNKNGDDQQNQLKLNYCKKPFANVDVKVFFATLEKYMRDKHKLSIRFNNVQNQSIFITLH